MSRRRRGGGGVCSRADTSGQNQADSFRYAIVT
ncbi:hypothetical protein MPTK1_7g04205 [Marchantia polymorpha subsp. ruderalis]